MKAKGDHTKFEEVTDRSGTTIKIEWGDRVTCRVFSSPLLRLVVTTVGNTL